jgi:hypothetical protein
MPSKQVCAKCKKRLSFPAKRVVKTKRDGAKHTVLMHNKCAEEYKRKQKFYKGL